jgi:hypothetical protein
MSASRIELVEARLVHVGPIAIRMRESDRIEVKAFNHSPKEALRLGLRASVGAFTVMIDDKPEGMMGLRPVNILEGEGAPWMLGTDELYRHPRAWLELMPKVVALWGDSTPSLSNLIAKTNVRAIRLLRRCGFEIGKEVTVIGGVEFVTFSLGETSDL